MDVILYLLASMAITLVQAGAVFPIDINRGLYMDETGRTCQLETPKNATLRDMPVTKAAELTTVENASLSVEYMTSYAVFDYIGCIDISSNQPTTTLSGIPRDSSPGVCYSACKTVNFAISETKLQMSTCYCFTYQPKLETTTTNLCQAKCSHPKGTPCGGFLHHASLYKKAPSDDVGEDSGRYCRFYNGTSKLFQWGNCVYPNVLYQPVYGICKNEYKKDNFTDIGGWDQYISRCFTPVYNFRYSYANKDDINNLWMATIKSRIYLKCFATSTTSVRISVSTPTPSSQHFKFAAYAGVPVLVTLVIGGLICFLVRKRKKRRKSGDSACIKEKTHSHGNDRSDEATRQQIPEKQCDANDAPRSLVNLNHLQKHIPDDTYDHTGVPIGVKYHTDDSVQNVYDSCVKMSDDTYDHTGVPVGAKCHADVSVENVYDSCVKISDDAYDHTGVPVSAKCHANVSVENVYDSCVKVSEDAYDHTGVPVGEKCQADVSVENVYDSCVKVSDDAYGHTGVPVGAKCHADVSVQNVYDSCLKKSDDTYDHTGVSVVVKGQADGLV